MYHSSYIQLVAAPVSMTIWVGGACPSCAVIVMGGGVIGLGTPVCNMLHGRVTSSLALSSFPVCPPSPICLLPLAPACLWHCWSVVECFLGFGFHFGWCYSGPGSYFGLWLGFDMVPFPIFANIYCFHAPACRSRHTLCSRLLCSFCCFLRYCFRSCCCRCYLIYCCYSYCCL